jgi:hypothetical protein
MTRWQKRQVRLAPVLAFGTFCLETLMARYIGVWIDAKEKPW